MINGDVRHMYPISSMMVIALGLILLPTARLLFGGGETMLLAATLLSVAMVVLGLYSALRRLDSVVR